MRNHNIPETVWQSDALNHNLNLVMNAANKATTVIKSGNIEQIKGALYILVTVLDNFEDNIKNMDKDVAKAFFRDDQQNQFCAQFLIVDAKNIANQITNLLNEIY
jgi:hypothetical protein